MAEGRDPEAVKELLDDCFGVLVPVIEAHGGTVDKIIGDELMAVWGAPRAHEDDPERAVRAALALLEALERLDPSLEMRVGINTGEVLAGPVGPGGAYTVTGDTVNTAHRLVGVAARAPCSWRVAPMPPPRTPSPTPNPPPTPCAGDESRSWPIRRSARRHRPGERVAPGTGTPMLGRDPELAQLVAAIADASGTGTGWRVVVVGEAGVGKSRLVDELQPALRRLGVGGRVEGVACAPYGDHGPLAPLTTLVRRVLGIPDGPPAEQRSAALGALEALAPSIDTDRQYLAHRTLQLLGLGELPGTAGMSTSPVRNRLSEELTSAARVVLEASAAVEPAHRDRRRRPLRGPAGPRRPRADGRRGRSTAGGGAGRTGRPPRPAAQPARRAPARTASSCTSARWPTEPATSSSTGPSPSSTATPAPSARPPRRRSSAPPAGTPCCSTSSSGSSGRPERSRSSKAAGGRSATSPRSGLPDDAAGAPRRPSRRAAAGRAVGAAVRCDRGSDLHRPRRCGAMGVTVDEALLDQIAGRGLLLRPVVERPRRSAGPSGT